MSIPQILDFAGNLCARHVITVNPTYSNLNLLTTMKLRISGCSNKQHFSVQSYPWGVHISQRGQLRKFRVSRQICLQTIKLRILYEQINFTSIYFLKLQLRKCLHMSTNIVALKSQNSLIAPSNIYDNAGSYYSCEIKRQRRQVLS